MAGDRLSEFPADDPTVPVLAEQRLLDYWLRYGPEWAAATVLPQDAPPLQVTPYTLHQVFGLLHRIEPPPHITGLRRRLRSMP